MVTIYKENPGSYGGGVAELRGLSTDQKPTDTLDGHEIANGCAFYEIDTGNITMFNKETGEWEDA